MFSAVDINKLCADNIDRVYHTLETLCICFPGRLSGTQTLEYSLEYLYKHAISSGIPEACCSQEAVSGVPCWIRGGDEKCTLHILPGVEIFPEPYPLTRQLRVLANGLSVGTNGETLSGEVVIANSWEHIAALGNDSQLRDKILLIDFQHFESYGDVNAFRNKGRVETGCSFLCVGSPLIVFIHCGAI